MYVLLQLTAFTPYGIFKLFLMSITTSRDWDEIVVGNYVIGCAGMVSNHGDLQCTYYCRHATAMLDWHDVSPILDSGPISLHRGDKFSHGQCGGDRVVVSVGIAARNRIPVVIIYGNLHTIPWWDNMITSYAITFQQDPMLHVLWWNFWYSIMSIYYHGILFCRISHHWEGSGMTF